MATEYSEIFGYVRTALLDTDPNIQLYSDDVLKSHIDLQLLSYDENIYAKTSATSFSNTLSNSEKLILAVEIAIRILIGNPSEFSYTNPIFSSRRKSNVSLMVSKLEDLLSVARGGNFAFESETSIEALVQHFNRYIEDVNSALSAG